LLLQNLKLVARGRFLDGLGGWSLASLSALSRRWYESFFVFVFFWVSLFARSVEGTVPEEVPMLMAFSASKRNVFIVDGLHPVLILVFQNDRSW
jgi:hypothetical protein